MSRAPIIHPGTRVGHLSVVASMPDGSGVERWECECDCGRRVIRRNDVLLTALRRGNAAGCGRGCGMRRTNRRAQGLMDDTGLIDWGNVMSIYRDLIAQYRAPAATTGDDA